MKIIYNKFIPFRGFLAINLFGICFVRSELKHRFTPVVENHELIHTAQMKELLYVFFYLWYILEWLLRLFLYLDFKEAYRTLLFEQEARANEKNMKYNGKRKRFAFLG